MAGAYLGTRGTHFTQIIEMMPIHNRTKAIETGVLTLEKSGNRRNMQIGSRRSTLVHGTPTRCPQFLHLVGSAGPRHNFRAIEISGFAHTGHGSIA
jgi:hypothetical protein